MSGIGQRLGNVSTITMGTSPKGHTYNEIGEGLPLLNGPTEFGPDHPACTLYTTDPKRECEPGDLIFCVRGSTTGRMNWADQKYALGRGVCSFRGQTDEDTRFIRYALENHLRRLLQFAGGATFPNLTKDILHDFRIPFPANRYGVVQTLSAYDDLIENNRRRIRLLEQAARLLYREWFVHLRFPEHEHVTMKNGLPEGWERKPLGDLLTLQRGFDLPVKKRKTGSIPIYASTGINGYHEVAKVKGPGVVTGRSGSLGTVMFVPCDFWPLNTTLWVKNFKLVAPHFATHLLSHMQLEQYNGGAAVPTLNRNDVHRVEVFCPPPVLRQLFEDQAHDMTKQIVTLANMNHKLAEARDLLLPQLMNGEIAL